MLHWTTIANFLGGIGLFLLGMRLMTDGLKMAAGGALRELLKDAFSGLDQALDLAAFAGDGILALLMFTGIGVPLTLLMQSSSAALAVTLTAAARGVISLEAAAGIVKIGGPIGT